MSPRAIVAAERAELLAEAKRWADDHDADPGELMLGLVRATAAHAALVERRLRERPDGDSALLLWHRMLETLDAEELEQLRHPTPTLTGGTR